MASSAWARLSPRRCNSYVSVADDVLRSTGFCDVARAFSASIGGHSLRGARFLLEEAERERRRFRSPAYWLG